MMVCKEKLNKNNLDGAKITDDGFPIGSFFCRTATHVMNSFINKNYVVQLNM